MNMQGINQRRVDWQPLIELIIVLATIVGTTVPLYLHTDGKLEEHRKETTEILRGIQQEMKDFHTKLALQDQEFKMRLCQIEERNKGK